MFNSCVPRLDIVWRTLNGTIDRLHVAQKKTLAVSLVPGYCVRAVAWTVAVVGPRGWRVGATCACYSTAVCQLFNSGEMPSIRN